MQVAGTSPDAVTFIFVLKCCGKLGAVAKGLEIHDTIERRGLIENNVAISCGLVEMYANLGSIVKAQELFDNLRVRGVVLWTALLAGYAELGEFENVLQLFRNMESEGTHPDSVTFIVVLNASGRVGMFSKGQMYLEMMSKDYGIDPMLEHYACIVDALSRVGHLEKAVSVALKMPESPDLVVWHSLLAACKYWGNFQIGKQAVTKLVQRLTSCGLKPVQTYECK
jgi:pentatricopeptide repeat protein